jgi:hypothetical protein
MREKLKSAFQESGYFKKVEPSSTFGYLVIWLFYR